MLITHHSTWETITTVTCHLVQKAVTTPNLYSISHYQPNAEKTGMVSASYILIRHISYTPWHIYCSSNPLDVKIYWQQENYGHWKSQERNYTLHTKIPTKMFSHFQAYINTFSYIHYTLTLKHNILVLSEMKSWKLHQLHL